VSSLLATAQVSHSIEYSSGTGWNAADKPGLSLHATGIAL
jgi:hypothetical protein